MCICPSLCRVMRGLRSKLLSLCTLILSLRSRMINFSCSSSPIHLCLKSSMMGFLDRLDGVAVMLSKEISGHRDVIKRRRLGSASLLKEQFALGLCFADIGGVFGNRQLLQLLLHRIGLWAGNRLLDSCHQSLWKWRIV